MGKLIASEWTRPVRENGESGIVDQLLFGLEAVFEGVESGGRT
jgi:hypothetical protein